MPGEARAPPFLSHQSRPSRVNGVRGDHRLSRGRKLSPAGIVLKVNAHCVGGKANIVLEEAEAERLGLRLNRTTCEVVK